MMSDVSIQGPGLRSTALHTAHRVQRLACALACLAFVLLLAAIFPAVSERGAVSPHLLRAAGVALLLIAPWFWVVVHAVNAVRDRQFRRVLVPAGLLLLAGLALL